MKKHVMMIPLLALAACTQAPAVVEIKDLQGNSMQASAGAMWPVRSAAVVAAPVSYAPVDQSSTQVVHTQSVGVSDLSAPANPWTGKPRAEAPQPAPMTLAKETHAAPAPAPTHMMQPAPREEAKVVELKPASAPAPLAPVAPVKMVSKDAFIWPVASQKVVSGYGRKGGGKVNDGINIASHEGEPVWAAAGGEVVYAGNDLKSYGNMVIVKHPGGKTSTYAHLSRIAAARYDRVAQGDIIGYVGATGDVKTPQLHFAMRSGKDPVDPKKFLSQSVASN